MKKARLLVAIAFVLVGILVGCNPAYLPDESPKIYFDKGLEGAVGERAYEFARSDFSYTVPGGVGFMGPKDKPVFAGWQVRDDQGKLGDLYARGEVVKDVKKDITLVALWEEGYVVEYLPGEGSGFPMARDAISKRNPQQYRLRANKYAPPQTPAGRVFTGWNVFRGESKTPEFMLPGQKIKNIKTHIKAVALWTKAFSVSYRAGDSTNDGNGTPAIGARDDESLAIGAVYSILGNTQVNQIVDKNNNKIEQIKDVFTLKKHAFIGWSLSRVVAGKEVVVGLAKEGEIITIDADIILTAQWEPGWNVEFQMNAPKNAKLDKWEDPESWDGHIDTVQDHGEYVLPTNKFIPDPEDRKFLGWEVTKAGALFDTAKPIWKPHEIIKDIQADLVVKALWQVSYSISFDGNGGTTSEVDNLRGIEPVEVLGGESCPLPIAAAGWKSPPGQIFLGWKLVDEDTGKVVDPLKRGEFTPTGNIKAVAQWGPGKTFIYKSGKAEIEKHTFHIPALCNRITEYDEDMLDPALKALHDAHMQTFLPQGEAQQFMVVNGDFITLKSPDALGYTKPAYPAETWTEAKDGSTVEREFVGWQIGANLYKPNAKFLVQTTEDEIVAVAQWKTLHTIRFKPTSGKIKPTTTEKPEVLVVDGATYKLPACFFFVNENNKSFYYWMIAGERFCASTETNPIYPTSIEVTRDIWIETMWRYRYQVTYHYNNRFINHETCGDIHQEVEKEDLKDKSETFGSVIADASGRPLPEDKPLWGGEPVPFPTRGIDTAINAYTPTHWGYEFDGWVRLEDIAKADAEKVIPGVTKVTNDMQLIARWKRREPANRAELEAMVDEYLARPDWPKYRELNFIELAAVELDDTQGLAHLFDGDDASRTGGDATKADNLKAFNGDVSQWDTSKVTNMEYLFNGTRVFNSELRTRPVQWLFRTIDGADAADYTAWDVSKVKSMKGMFKGAELFNQPFTDWDTASLTDMSEMLMNARNFNQTQLTQLNTSKVTTMAHLFDGAISFVPWTKTFVKPKASTTPDQLANSFSFDLLEGWDTSKVTDMSFMFRGCDRVSGWAKMIFDTSSVTNMESMFENAAFYDRKNIDKDAPFDKLRSTEHWDLSKVQNFKNMFKNCWVQASGDTSFQSILYPWNVESATDMSGMFEGCRNLTELWLGNWNVSKVTDMSRMFKDCENIAFISFKENAGEWDMSKISNVTDFSHMFENTSKLKHSSPKLRVIGTWDLSSIPADKKADMFTGSGYPAGGSMPQGL